MTTAYDALDDFAGPGGWDLGAALLGLTALGIEWDKAACATAEAAGFARERADVSTHDATPWRGQIPLYIASPPCTLFSTAGKGTGRAALGILADGIKRMFAGEDCRAEVRETIYRQITLPARWAEHRAKSLLRRRPGSVARVAAAAREDAFIAALVLEPARRILELDPERVAMEQVPAVLPLWEVYGYELRQRGWSTWTGVLNAADYGVPQTRKRAIFMGSRVSVVAPPVPTHAEHPEDGDLFGTARVKWISMADALGISPTAEVTTRGEHVGGGNVFDATGPSWAMTGRARSWAIDRRTNSKTAGGGMAPTALVSIERPAPTLTSKAGCQWVLRMGNQSGATARAADEPAPTIAFGHNAASMEWIHRRPATTIVGSFGADTVSPPGYRLDVSRQNAEGGVKITVAEGGVLQSFPPDWPWQGTRTKQFEQVGNAVPPLLAAHVLAALCGLTLAAAA